ncbi:hypothetical protein ACTNEN_01940 [Oribacterium sp. HCP28S3_H8]
MEDSWESEDSAEALDKYSVDTPGEQSADTPEELWDVVDSVDE